MIKHILVLLALCLAVVTTGCKEEENGSLIYPRFTIETENVTSWEVGTDFVKITLDEPTATQFKAFTSTQLNQTIAIYIGSKELFTPKIETLGKDNDIYLAKLTADQKAAVGKLLPSGKKIEK